MRKVDVLELYKLPPFLIAVCFLWILKERGAGNILSRGIAPMTKHLKAPMHTSAKPRIVGGTSFRDLLPRRSEPERRAAASCDRTESDTTAPPPALAPNAGFRTRRDMRK